MEIIDYVAAATIEEGDQILFENDPIEVQSKVDSVTAIMVKGYSHMSGDNVVYILDPDVEVGIWTA